MRFLGRIFAALLLLGLVIVLTLAGLLAYWRTQPATSTLMLARNVSGQPVTREWVPLERIAGALPAAVLMSEDGQFCRHHGVDWKALGTVLDEADADEGPARGASTITMQVVKNLFLWPGRSTLRKGLEIPLALLLDAAWPKRRIMEVYLNIAEWGPDGVFGAQAAARRAFGKDAASSHAARCGAARSRAPEPDPARSAQALPRRGGPGGHGAGAHARRGRMERLPARIQRPGAR